MNRALRQQLAAADPGRPWFAAYDATLRAGRRAIESGASVAQALCALSPADPADAVPRFVAAFEWPAGPAYEAFVARTGTVPTRDNLHDFFNGLVWLRFTCSKRRLNELQASEIARAGIGRVRGPVRDAITVFDENGAVLAAPPALWEALVARDWQRLFVQLRPLWAAATLIVFGHALLEQLLRPRKDLTAHVWAANAPWPAGGPLDHWLAAQLSADRLARKPFTPLPLLGIPLWWSGNEDVSFYDDALVFRPAGASRRAPCRPAT